MSNVAEIDAAGFETEVVGSDGTVVVDFWAPWCGPCKTVGPEIDKLAARLPDVKFVKLNVDESAEIAVRYGVMSIPTILKFESGEVSAQIVGARSADSLARELALV